jgi:hypothetical protein
VTSRWPVRSAVSLSVGQSGPLPAGRAGVLMRCLCRSIKELAVDEGRASADQGDQMGCVVSVPHRRGDRRERDAERARQHVRPARVRLHDVERAFLGPARGEVRRLRELRDFLLRRRAAIAAGERLLAYDRARWAASAASGGVVG